MRMIDVSGDKRIQAQYIKREGQKVKGIELPYDGLFLMREDLRDGDTYFGCQMDNLEYPASSTECLSDELRVGQLIGVLNYGFVELQEVQGSDAAIVAAARTSYATGSKSSGDETLLRYLIRNLHTTPVEMCGIKLRIYMPIVVYRQFFRHRAAVQLEPEFISNDSAFQKFSVQNEMSGRYVELPDHYYLPEYRRILAQSKTNRQGSEEGSFDEHEQKQAHAIFAAANSDARAKYEQLLAKGIAKETARNVLPLTQYTLLVWKIDLKNLQHFLSLRLDAHAQWEVRQYAKAISLFIKKFFPMTWKAFEDYQLNAVRLSNLEATVLLEQLSIEDREKMIRIYANRNSNEREQKEFAAKLGVSLP